MVYRVRLFVTPAGNAPPGTKTREVPGFVIDTDGGADVALRLAAIRLDAEHPGRVVGLSPASAGGFVATVRPPSAPRT